MRNVSTSPFHCRPCLDCPRLKVCSAGLGVLDRQRGLLLPSCHRPGKGQPSSLFSRFLKMILFVSFIWTPSLWLVFIFFGFLANRLQPKRCWCCLLARVRLTRNLFWMINHLELYMVASVLPRDCWFSVLRSCLCSKKTRVQSNLIPNVSSLLGFKVTWKNWDSTFRPKIVRCYCTKSKELITLASAVLPVLPGALICLKKAVWGK